MADPDPKRPVPPVPPGSAPGLPEPGVRSRAAVPPEPDPASPAFDILEGTPRVVPATPERPENLVAEIVDQITEKQTRAARRPEAGTEETCAFCLEETIVRTPYRVILKCTSGEPDVS